MGLSVVAFGSVRDFAPRTAGGGSPAARGRRFYIDRACRQRAAFSFTLQRSTSMLGGALDAAYVRSPMHVKSSLADRYIALLKKSLVSTLLPVAEMRKGSRRAL